MNGAPSTLFASSGGFQPHIRKSASMLNTRSSTPSSTERASTPTNPTSVQVAIRVRPPSRNDRPPRFHKGEILSVATENGILTVNPTGKKFAYDYVLGSYAKQADIFESCVTPLLGKFLEGYNVTILAYGQTSSGKTFTMGTGHFSQQIPPEEYGIIPRAASTLFEVLDASPANKHQMFVSFLELYNEELIDLLAPGASRSPITIREDARGHIYWTGVKEMEVASASELLRYLEAGSLQRQTGSTDMNEKSSRSHAIFSITLRQEVTVAKHPQQNKGATHLGRQTPNPSAMESYEQGYEEPRNDGERMMLNAKLHFVDLAGSERLKHTQAVGDRVREGICINSGLLALGNVVSALGDASRRSTHIPYRDSKLTRLLQDSLGGNSQTLMIACVSPAEANLTETLNTLNYANRARNIKNKAVLNQDMPDNVEYLKRQILQLKSEIKVLKEDGHQTGNLLTTRSKSSNSFYAADHQMGISRGGKHFELLEMELQQTRHMYEELYDRHHKLSVELALLQEKHYHQQENQFVAGNCNSDGLSFARDLEPFLAQYEQWMANKDALLENANRSLREAEQELQGQREKLSQGEKNLIHSQKLLGGLKARLVECLMCEENSKKHITKMEADLSDTHQTVLRQEMELKRLKIELEARNSGQANNEEQCTATSELESGLHGPEDDGKCRPISCGGGAPTLHEELEHARRALAQYQSLNTQLQAQLDKMCEEHKANRSNIRRLEAKVSAFEGRGEPVDDWRRLAARVEELECEIVEARGGADVGGASADVGGGAGAEGGAGADSGVPGDTVAGVLPLDAGSSPDATSPPLQMEKAAHEAEVAQLEEPLASPLPSANNEQRAQETVSIDRRLALEKKVECLETELAEREKHLVQMKCQLEENKRSPAGNNGSGATPTRSLMLEAKYHQVTRECDLLFQKLVHLEDQYTQLVCQVADLHLSIGVGVEILCEPSMPPDEIIKSLCFVKVRVKALKEENDKLQQQNSSLATEIDAMKKEAKEKEIREKEIGEERNACARRVSELEAKLMQTFVALERKENELQNELLQSQHDNRKWAEQTDLLQQKLEEATSVAKTDRNTLLAQIDLLESSNAEYVQYIAETQAELKRISEEKGKLEAVREKYEELSAENQALRDDLEAMEDLVDSVCAENQKLGKHQQDGGTSRPASRVVASTAELRRLEERVKHLEATNADLEQQLSTVDVLRKKIAELENTNASAGANEEAVKQLEEELLCVVELNEGQSRELEDTRKMISHLQRSQVNGGESISALRSKIAEQETLIAQQTSTIQKQERRLVEMSENSKQNVAPSAKPLKSRIPPSPLNTEFTGVSTRPTSASYPPVPSTPSSPTPSRPPSPIPTAAVNGHLTPAQENAKLKIQITTLESELDRQISSVSELKNSLVVSQNRQKTLEDTISKLQSQLTVQMNQNQTVSDSLTSLQQLFTQTQTKVETEKQRADQLQQRNEQLKNELQVMHKSKSKFLCF